MSRRLLLVLVVASAATLPALAGTSAASRPAAQTPKAATSDPPLAETLSWLKDRFISDGGYPYPAGSPQYQVLYVPLTFSTCTLRWITQKRSATDSPDDDKMTVPLSTLDPAKLNPENITDGEDGSFRVTLWTKKLQKTIQIEASNGTRLMSGILNVYFRDRPMAERVAKAVAHAATLCANEPF